MECRPGCGACCIAISISSPLPGMPEGKPAGVMCVNLNDERLCRLYGSSAYPAVCAGLTPLPEMCGADSREAEEYLAELEDLTAPSN
jgi:uncharacterized protein